MYFKNYLWLTRGVS